MSHYGGYPPAYGGVPSAQPPAAQPPNNHLVWAILSTIFCCLPLGIVSIVFAAQVNSKWAAGDFAGAQDSADKARKFAIWSAVLGFLGTLIAVVLSVGFGVALLPALESGSETGL